MALKDLTGQRFGDLVALSVSHSNEKTDYWNCICDCGRSIVRPRRSLLHKKTFSCGCHKKTKPNRGHFKSTHGHSRREDGRLTPEYNSWRSIKHRTTNPSCRQYPQYGGRGITMCDEWLDSFEQFFADMGPRPAPGYSIDRIDNDKGYSPENCRWATRAEQAQNRRNSKVVEYNGETVYLSELADRLGVCKDAAYNRVFNLGWDIDRALTTPVRRRNA